MKKGNCKKKKNKFYGYKMIYYILKIWVQFHVYRKYQLMNLAIQNTVISIFISFQFFLPVNKYTIKCPKNKDKKLFIRT